MKKRTKQVIFKVTEEENVKIRDGAQLSGLRLSAWMRDVLLAEAERLEREKASETTA